HVEIEQRLILHCSPRAQSAQPRRMNAQRAPRIDHPQRLLTARASRDHSPAFQSSAENISPRLAQRVWGRPPETKSIRPIFAPPPYLPRRPNPNAARNASNRTSLKTFCPIRLAASREVSW